MGLLLLATAVFAQNVEWVFVGWDFEFDKTVLSEGIANGTYRLGKLINNVARRPGSVVTIIVDGVPHRTGEESELYLLDPSKPGTYSPVYVKKIVDSAPQSPAYTQAPEQRKADSVPFAYILGYNAPFSAPFDFSSGGFSFSVEQPKKEFIVPYIPFNLSIDYIHTGKEKSWEADETYHISSGENSSVIFGTAFGYPALDWLLIYAGGGLGFTWYTERDYSNTTDPNPGYSYNNSKEAESVSFAYKLNGGVRFMLYDFFALKLDASYGTIIGPTFGVGAGIVL
jgi:opacity protein-like surface antigen